jgi:hypothetical protein
MLTRLALAVCALLAVTGHAFADYSTARYTAVPTLNDLRVMQAPVGGGIGGPVEALVSPDAGTFYSPVQLMGNNSPGDGGGGIFYWAPGSTAADDGNITIKPQGVVTGRWIRAPYSSLQISGGSIDGTPIGQTTPAAGAFTALSASGTVSGAGFSTYFASPPAIGGTVPAAGSFTALSGSVTSTGATTGRTLASHFGDILYAEDYSGGTAHNDFVHDDGAMIQAALNQASTNGSGIVYLHGKSYWTQESITVPAGVVLGCDGAFTGTLGFTATSYQNRACAIYFASGTSLVLSGRVRDLELYADLVHFTSTGTTRQSMETYIASFTGTGIAIGAGGGATGPGEGAVVDHVMIGGFGTAIAVNGPDKVHLENILADTTSCYSIVQSFDVDYLDKISCWQFLTTNQTHTFDQWTITSIADNGSGAWRLTLSAVGTPSAITTGEQLWVNPGTPGQGGEGIAGGWTVTMIDSTHVDLQGSKVSPTPTGNTTSGATYIGSVSSLAGVQAGMTVSGTGIPAGATVGAVWWERNAISLDQAHAATATNTGVTLTFASNTYTASSATLNYDGTWRTGTCAALGRDDGLQGSNLFCFGFLVGFNFEAATGNSIVNLQVDQIAEHFPNSGIVPIGVEFTGGATTFNNTIVGTNITTSGIGVLANTGGNQYQFLQGFRIGAPSSAVSTPAVDVENGALTLIGFQGAEVHSILLDNAASPATVMAANDFPGALVYSTVAKPGWLGGGNNFGGALQFTGPGNFAAQQLTAAAPTGPALNLYDASQGTNGKYWRWGGDNGPACLDALTDTYTSPVSAICASRSGASVSAVSLGGAIGAESMRVYPVASAVNHFAVQGAITGSSPFLAPEGTDTNINLAFDTKGNGAYFFSDGAQGTSFAIAGASGTLANNLQVNPAGAGSAPSLQATGSDSAVSLTLSTKGGGTVNTAASTAFNGALNQFGSGSGAPGHLASGQTTAPALTSCGTNPAIVGTDTAGHVTMGTGTPTGCVITFNAAYTAAPFCVVTWEATPLASQSYVVSNSNITLTQTGTSSNKADYICIGASGG